MRFLVVAVLAACGDEPEPLDFGEVSETYPAYQPPVPQVLDMHGAKMRDVRVVPIFYKADALADPTVEFLTKFAAGPYWPQMVGEYGVRGGLTIAPAVHLATAAPATITEEEIQALLKNELDGTHPEVGPTDPATLARTIFAMSFDPTTVQTIDMLGTSCATFGGYHGNVPFSAANGAPNIVYTASWRCTTSRFTGPTDFATIAIAHELVEAATDPLPRTGWVNTPIADGGWTEVFEGELADMCEYRDIKGVATSLYVKPADVGYNFARSWSNAAAAAYADPCVPAPAGPYFAASPVENDMGPHGRTTRIPTGKSKTIELQLWSTGPTDDFTIEVYDQATVAGKAPELELELDRTSGRNGQKVHLKATALTSEFKMSMYRIRAVLPDGRDSVWWGAVSATSE